MALKQNDMKACQRQTRGGSAEITLCVSQQTKHWSVVYRQLACCVQACALFSRGVHVIATQEWYATSLARLPSVFYLLIRCQKL